MQNKKLHKIVLDALEELKAEDIVSLDVHAVTTITDYMIIVSARSSRHLHSIADNVVTRAKENHHLPMGIEGQHSNEWVLIDLGEIVVHVMTSSTRQFYELEKLWSINH